MASIHFFFYFSLFLLLAPFLFSCLITQSLDNVGGKCRTRLACYDYQHLLYLEHYGGCLDFNGSHIIILSFSFTAVIISFLHSLSSPGRRQARNENAKQTCTSISQCVCVDKREGRDLFRLTMDIGQMSKSGVFGLHANILVHR